MPQKIEGLRVDSDVYLSSLSQSSHNLSREMDPHSSDTHQQGIVLMLPAPRELSLWLHKKDGKRSTEPYAH